MPVRIVVSLGGGVHVTEGNRGPLVELAFQLTDESVATQVQSQEPQGHGVTFSEVVLIYVGMKALDNLTEKAIDQLFARIVSIAKSWAKARVRERIESGAQRIRSTFVEIHDEEGKQIGPCIEVKANQQGEVEVEELPRQGDSGISRPIQFDRNWIEGEEDDSVGDPEF